MEAANLIVGMFLLIVLLLLCTPPWGGGALSDAAIRLSVCLFQLATAAL